MVIKAKGSDLYPDCNDSYCVGYYLKKKIGSHEKVVVLSFKDGKKRRLVKGKLRVEYLSERGFEDWRDAFNLYFRPNNHAKLQELL